MPVDRIAALIIFSLAEVLVLFTLQHMYRNGTRPARNAAFWLSLVVIGWLVTYEFELLSRQLNTIITLNRLKWLFVASAAPSWLILVLALTGKHEWLLPRRVLLLFSVPMVAVLLNFTAGWYDFMWDGYLLLKRGSLSLLIKSNSTGYYIYIIYAYLVLLIATYLLFRSIIRSQQLFRRQGLLLITATLAPFTASLLETLDIGIFNLYDLTPFGFVVSAPLVALALPRMHLMQIVPIARHTIVEHIPDSVIVLDNLEQIVDINPSAEALFSIDANDLIGQPANLILNRYPSLAATQPPTDTSQEIALTIGGTEQHFDLLTTSLKGNKNEYLGRFLVLHDITERKLVEQQVNTSLQEKEVLLKEIHHRVKNNLQIISSLLNIQVTKIADPLAAAPLRDSQDRVRSMALIHEHLYQSPTLSEVNMQTYLENLTGQLASSNQGANSANVAIEVNANDLLLNIDQSITCGLIVTELFSNAYKHAFPQRKDGRISVTLQRSTPDQFCLEVSDNGVGLSANFDLDQTDSLGMQLVQTLTAQLNGTLELLVDHGTTIQIRF